MEPVVLQELCAQMAREIPGFSVGFKDQSWHQKALGALLWPINRRYVDGYVTVLGRTAWWPSEARFRADAARSIGTLLHERVHLWDWRDNPLWFPASYVAFGPAVWTKRAHWERRGYVIDLVLQQQRGITAESQKRWMNDVFCGSDYGWMWPRPAAVADWVDRVRAEGLAVELSGALLHTTQAWVDRLAPPRS